MSRIRRPEDLVVGSKYGLLTITGPPIVEHKKNGKKLVTVIHYPCRCDCGNVRPINWRTLLEKEEPSCGCTRWARRKLHSKAKGLCYTRLYGIWNAMNKRCYNENDHSYRNYGGRGITVCDEWRMDFLVFMEWAINNGYKENLTIERMNNDLGYSPENCSWKSRKEQGRNRRSNHNLSYNGETRTVTEWAEITGISFTTITRRLARGWSIEDALTKDPADTRRRANKRELKWKE